MADGKITTEEWIAELMCLGAIRGNDNEKVAHETLNRAFPYSASSRVRSRRPQRGGASKYKGVAWRPDTGRWRVQITDNHRSKYLGMYDDEKEAALAYDKAALILWPGEALTNQMAFPEDFK